MQSEHWIERLICGATRVAPVPENILALSRVTFKSQTFVVAQSSAEHSEGIGSRLCVS